MHVLETQDDLAGIKAHLLLRKHPVLGEVVVHVTPCNQRPRMFTESRRGHPKEQGATEKQNGSFFCLDIRLWFL